MSIKYNVREAVRWPEEGYKQSFRNSEMGKNRTFIVWRIMKSFIEEVGLIRWGELQ